MRVDDGRATLAHLAAKPQPGGDVDARLATDDDHRNALARQLGAELTFRVQAPHARVDPVRQATAELGDQHLRTGHLHLMHHERHRDPAGHHLSISARTGRIR